MKILAINGSSRSNGNTRRLLDECKKYSEENVDFEIVNLSQYSFEGCRACEGCSTSGKCVINDDMQTIYKKIEESKGLILASPTYFYNLSSNMKKFIERLYPYLSFDKDNRHVWINKNELTGIKYCSIIAVCEQIDEKDMGFTLDAMKLPIESLGYRVVDTMKVLNVFKSDDIEKYDNILSDTNRFANKLISTIKLSEENRKL